MNILEFSEMYDNLDVFFNNVSLETLTICMDSNSLAEELWTTIDERALVQTGTIDYFVRRLPIEEQKNILEYMEIHPELRKIEDYFQESKEIYTKNHIQGHSLEDWSGADLEKNQLAVLFHEEPDFRVQESIENFIENKFNVNYLSGDIGLIIIEKETV